MKKQRLYTTINEFKQALIKEGRGNVSLRYDGKHWPIYYIKYYDFTDIDEDGNEFENPDANDYFVDDVAGNIKHFKTINLTKLDKQEWINNDTAVYFEGENIRVCFIDNEWSMGVGLIPIYDYDENDEEIIPDGFNEEASKFFNELNSIYQLYKSTSAWTSSPVEGDIIINENNDTIDWNKSNPHSTIKLIYPPKPNSLTKKFLDFIYENPGSTKADFYKHINRELTPGNNTDLFARLKNSGLVELVGNKYYLGPNYGKWTQGKLSTEPTTKYPQYFH